MEKQKPHRGQWLSTALMRLCAILRRLPLLFDVKVVILIFSEKAIWTFLAWFGRSWDEEVRALEDKARASRAEEQRKKAVVLDGVSRNGREVAARLLALGYDVVIGGETNDELHAAKDELNGSSPGAVQGFRCGMDKKEKVIAFLVSVQKLWKEIDLLVMNGTKYHEEKKKYAEITKSEKKIVPARKNRSFITKAGSYRRIERVLIEKDSNIKFNYRNKFLIIRGLSSQLRRGEGRVVIVSNTIHKLVMPVYRRLLFPSMFYSFSYGEFCGVLLGLGAKARYKHLDVRIVHPGQVLADYLPRGVESGVLRKVLGLFTVSPRDFARSVLYACIAPNALGTVRYYNYVFDEPLDGTVTYDLANDFWEQAEVVS